MAELSSEPPVRRTARLTLRGWRPEDRPAMHAVNGDAAVMATIGPVMTPAESDAAVERMAAGWAERGYGLWCVDLAGTCIGFTGLNRPWFDEGFVREIEASGQPCVEVGWRLASAHWGHGYAPEAAAAALDFAFDDVGLDQVVSFTSATNTKSGRVMDKLGLRRDPDHDFDHPSLPVGDRRRPHVLYRITRAEADRLPWRRDR